MNENIINDAEFTEAEAPEGDFSELKNFDTSQLPSFDQIQQALKDEDANKQSKEKLSLSDRIADLLGIFISLLLITGVSAIALSFFLTFIPSIHFTLLHFLKCWSGVFSLVCIKGILQTKIL